MFKKQGSLLAILFCMVLLSGCNEDARIQKAVPAEAGKLSQEFLSALEAQNADGALKLIEPEVRKEATDKVKNIAQLFKDGKPQSIKPVGVRSQRKEDERFIQISYQLYYADKAIVATLVILETPKSRFIVSARLDPIPQPLEKIYAFKLLGKSFFHYVLLLLWIAVPLFILYVLWGCIRSSLKWKWIWAVAILLAFFPIYLDWNSGRAFIRLVTVVLLGVSYAKQKYSPLILCVGLPVGAIVFYFKYMFRKPSVPASINL